MSVLLLSTVQFIYCFIQCSKSYLEEKNVTIGFILEIVYVSPLLLGLQFEFLSARKKEIILRMVNRFLRQERQLAKKYALGLGTSRVRTVVIWFLRGVCIQICFATCFFLASPNNRIFVYQLFGFPWYWSIFWAAFEMYPYSLAFLYATFCVNFGISSLSSNLYWLRHLRYLTYSTCRVG